MLLTYLRRLPIYVAHPTYVAPLPTYVAHLPTLLTYLPMLLTYLRHLHHSPNYLCCSPNLPMLLTYVPYLPTSLTEQRGRQQVRGRG